jgi:hypothetical protein
VVQISLCRRPNGIPEGERTILVRLPDDFAKLATATETVLVTYVDRSY